MCNLNAGTGTGLDNAMCSTTLWFANAVKEATVARFKQQVPVGLLQLCLCPFALHQSQVQVNLPVQQAPIQQHCLVFSSLQLLLKSVDCRCLVCCLLLVRYLGLPAGQQQLKYLLTPPGNLLLNRGFCL